MMVLLRSVFILTSLLLVDELFCDDSTAAFQRQTSQQNETICFEILGCIETSDEWYSIKRPVNLPPSTEIATTFTLYTKENQVDGETLLVSASGDVSTRSYNPDKDTKLIIHGFKSAATNKWVEELVQSLLRKLDINVIAVDWSKGADTAYTQAISNIRVVGLEVANLVNALIERKGTSASAIHLIGHSLGAHTAGYAGERITGLGRITGLDPAGPLFNALPPFVRLDASDAEFVDVIHSDAEDLGYGIQDTSGHVDFFPNGGYRQPGAKVPGIPLAVIPREIANATNLGSSHGRAVQLFLDSVEALDDYPDDYLRQGGRAISKCTFVGIWCESYEAFLEGNCTSCGEDGMRCALMGIQANNYPVRGQPSSEARKFFLRTNSSSPFCGYHYAVKLALAKESEGRNEVAGDLTATVIGHLGVTSDMSLTERGARKMKKGEFYSFIGYSPINAGNVAIANITWKWNPKLFSKESCLLNCVKDIFVSRVEVTNLGYFPRERYRKTVKSIQHGFTEIKNGNSAIFNLV